MGTDTKPESKGLVHITLGHDLHRAALERARLEDRSTASLVRRALREFLERDGETKE